MSTKAVLRRMAASPGRVKDAELSAWSPVWRSVIPRVCDEAMGVEARLQQCSDADLSLGDLLEQMTGGLVLNLHGRDGQTGFAHLDGSMLAALIEAQTTGRVADTQAPDRAATRTDAAVVSPIVDRWIAAAEGGLEHPEPLPWSGLRVKGQVADRRALEIHTEDGAFEVVTLNISFGEGAKTGTLRLAVRKSLATELGPNANKGALLDETVLAARARMNIVLDRSHVPIGWVKNLAPGDTLAVPRAKLSDARVEAVSGAFVAFGRIGQTGGRRAVRLTMVDQARASEITSAVSGAVTAQEQTSVGLNVDAALPDLPETHGGPEIPDLPDIATAEPAKSVETGLPELPTEP